jgi:hypothetical protein
LQFKRKYFIVQSVTLEFSPSLRWRDHFLHNRWRDGEIPWTDPRRLTDEERRAVARSVQQFQLGERAEGRGLQRRGAEFAARAGDRYFAEALRLFVGEEQRHSAQLGRWMDLEGIPRVERHWVDQWFRHLRKLAGLELAVSVLVTAEIIAVPYYRALRGATGSPILRALCERILLDESAHLRFQAFNLARLRTGRGGAIEEILWAVHRWFLAAATLLVWWQHASVFRAAGYTYRRFLGESLGEFRALQADACNQSTYAQSTGAAVRMEEDRAAAIPASPAAPDHGGLR